MEWACIQLQLTRYITYNPNKAKDKRAMNEAAKAIVQMGFRISACVSNFLVLEPTVSETREGNGCESQFPY